MFKITILIFSGILLFTIISLLVLRIYDWYEDKTEWDNLLSKQSKTSLTYSPEMVTELPEPVRRFFNFAIKPGTPLITVAEIKMEGQFSLGSKDQPNYKAMRATQILAAPHGFVWQLELPGTVPISGSDSSKWTRFRIFGLLPVARMGGEQDHKRSAFGRYVAEAVFWTPAALLPSEFIFWEELGDNKIRMTMTYSGLIQSVDIEIDPFGKPSQVYFMRWSNANPEKIFQLQPFGGVLSDFREVQGYRVPFDVQAGNMFGTEDYFPFFKAKIHSVRFLDGL